MRKPLQRLFNRLARRRLERTLPGITADLAAYAEKSNTTGTQPITLWMAVKTILKHRPTHILESGTGASTLVLAATIQKLRAQNPGYKGHITSMESVPEWFEIARANLPDKYAPEATLILGPREEYRIGPFRGFIHSNIPQKDYDFVLLDAPAFTDADGVAFCADIFRAMDLSTAKRLRGVVDGRAHSVMVLQILFGTRAARYWHSLFAATFDVPKVDLRDPELRTPQDFRCSPLGRLSYVKFRR